MCLRSLAGVADQVWTMCIKESVALAVVGPWVLCRVLRRKYPMPRLAVLAGLAAVGAAVQLVGNLNVLAAFGTIGLATTIPVLSAVNLSTGAVLAWMVLGERVSVRSALAIGLLILSITILQQGTDTSIGLENLARARSSLAGICLAGMVFAVMGVSIRKSLAGAVPRTLIVLIIPGMAALTLGPLAWTQHGLDGLLTIQPQHLALMLLAGLLNVVAFFAYTSALRLVTVVQASSVNAAQVAMAALAGVCFFSETPSAMLLLGVGLTIVGILLIGRPVRRRPSEWPGETPPAGSLVASDNRNGDLFQEIVQHQRYNANQNSETVQESPVNP
jgi:drug/metabolite transporter (DMT)-like permease